MSNERFLKGVPSPQHALKFCQFVEDSYKGLNIKYLLCRVTFGDMKFANFEKSHFPAILTSDKKLVLTESPILTKSFEKIWYVKSCSLSASLWGDMFFFLEKVSFS
jgi:hypothetical protein